MARAPDKVQSKKVQGPRLKRLPRYRLCWWCNSKLYGDKFAEVLAQGHVRVVHKACRKSVEQANESALGNILCSNDQLAPAPRISIIPACFTQSTTPNRNQE